MKSFLVTLTIQIGDFEKVVHRLLKGIDATSVGRRALTEECHCDFGDGAEMNGDTECDDDDGGMYYVVTKVVEVQPNHVPTLEIYLK